MAWRELLSMLPLKAFERPLGLLITFNVALLKNGIRLVVNSRR